MSNTDKTAAKVFDEFCARVMVIPEAEREAYLLQKRALHEGCTI